MIRMIRQDAMRTIQLFSQHDPDEGMWKRQSRERPFEITPLQYLGRVTVGTADHEGEITSIL